MQAEAYFGQSESLPTPVHEELALQAPSRSRLSEQTRAKRKPTFHRFATGLIFSHFSLISTRGHKNNRLTPLWYLIEA